MRKEDGQMRHEETEGGRLEGQPGGGNLRGTTKRGEREWEARGKMED